MRSKLSQMNGVLTDVIARMSTPEHRDSLLLVVGDHGMTATGDHGGSSADETDSALFAFVPPESHFVFHSLPVFLLHFLSLFTTLGF